MPIEQVTREYAEKARAGLADAVSLLDDLNPMKAEPIVRLVLRELRVAAVEAANAIADMLVDAPAAAPSKRQRPAGEHRHKFGPEGRCQVPSCDRVKSAAGRKPASEAPPPVDPPRQQPFRPIGNPDQFADGAQGSSGVRR